MQTYYFISGGDFIKITSQTFDIAKELMNVLHKKGFYQIKEPKKVNVTYSQRA